MPTTLRKLSYNIAGLKSKINSFSFLEYLKQFDVVCFLETFVLEEEIKKIDKYFPDFKLKWKIAKKSSRFGRTSGEILLGINKTYPGFDLCSFETTEEFYLLKMKLSSREPFYSICCMFTSTVIIGKRISYQYF